MYRVHLFSTKVPLQGGPWKRKWQPTPVFLPGEPQGQKRLAGYSPWGHKESDTTEQLTLSYLHMDEPVILLPVSGFGKDGKGHKIIDLK